jgi:hypothetical protein
MVHTKTTLFRPPVTTRGDTTPAAVGGATESTPFATWLSFGPFWCSPVLGDCGTATCRYRRLSNPECAPSHNRFCRIGLDSKRRETPTRCDSVADTWPPRSALSTNRLPAEPIVGNARSHQQVIDGAVLLHEYCHPGNCTAKSATSPLKSCTLPWTGSTRSERYPIKKG